MQASTYRSGNLSAIPSKEDARTVVKRGWLKKRGTLPISAWKHKWAVITSGESPCLLVFDNRDSMTVKHRLSLPAERVEFLDDVALMKKNDFPFSVVSNDRKYFFAAESSSDRESWMNALMLYGELPPLRSASRIRNGSLQKPIISTQAWNAAPMAGIEDSPTEVVNSLAPSAPALSLFDMQVLSFQDLEDLEQGRVPAGQDGEQGNWNARYQYVFKTPATTVEDRMRKDVELCKLIGAFKQTAVQRAKDLIDNYHLTSKDSLHYNDIVFQLATNDANSNMDQASLAMIRTNNELRTINSVNQFDHEIRTSLMCLVDYKGFRVICYAAMPLDENKTLACHLADDDDPRINDKCLQELDKVGACLNLKPHSVIIKGGRKFVTTVSARTEVHHLADEDEFYALNLCEWFPVDAQFFAEDSQGTIDVACQRRLRPEFVQNYSTPLSSDALGDVPAPIKETQANDQEVIRATAYLNDQWVPAVVKKLDELNVLPLDGVQFSQYLHSEGVNICYLGAIAQQTTLPHIRELCLSEMVARAGKRLFGDSIRRAIIHFKSTGAKRVEDELINYTVMIFQNILGRGNKVNKYFEEKLKAVIKDAFEFDMTLSVFNGLHRPSLFIALQQQCGVQFDQRMDYDFTSATPVQRTDFRGFVSRVKHVEGQWQALDECADESAHIYALARHLAAQGGKNKLEKSNITADKLLALAQDYSANQAWENARIYVRSALNVADKNHAIMASILKTQMEIELMSSGPSVEVLGRFVYPIYCQAKQIAGWHWGPDHPIVMDLEETFAQLCQQVGDLQGAIDHQTNALGIAGRTLGQRHMVTVAIGKKMAFYLGDIERFDEAAEKYQECLNQLLSMPGDNREVSSDLHMQMAKTFMSKGDVDSALCHAQECRKIRESLFGQHHERTIATYSMLAKLTLHDYLDYNGVITPEIRKVYSTALGLYERIYKHLSMTRDTQSSTKMFSIVKRMVDLKLKLLNPQQLQVLRMAKTDVEPARPEESLDAVRRLVAINPVIVLDELFQRVAENSDDVDALRTLQVIIQVTEE